MNTALVFLGGVLVGIGLSAIFVAWGRWIGEGQLVPVRKRRSG